MTGSPGPGAAHLAAVTEQSSTQTPPRPSVPSLEVAATVTDTAGVTWYRYRQTTTDRGSWHAPGIGWRRYYELDLPEQEPTDG